MLGHDGKNIKINDIFLSTDCEEDIFLMKLLYNNEKNRFELFAFDGKDFTIDSDEHGYSISDINNLKLKRKIR